MEEKLKKGGTLSKLATIHSIVGNLKIRRTHFVLTPGLHYRVFKRLRIIKFWLAAHGFDIY